MRSMMVGAVRMAVATKRSGEPPFKVAHHLLVLLAAAVLLSATGCTKAPGKKGKLAADGSGAKEDGTADGEGVDTDTAIAVDDGKVEVCSPTGWTRAPQSKDYLVKYIPSRKKTFPSIVVMAADAPEGITEVDGDAQKDFVAAIAASLAETYSKNGKSTLIKKPAAVRLGPHFGATWAAPATMKVDGVKESIDRTSYALIIDGRMYTVEVRAPKGKLDGDGRAAARAVAAAITPPGGAEEPEVAEDAPADPEPAAEEAPAAKPDAAAEQQ